MRSGRLKVSLRAMMAWVALASIQISAAPWIWEATDKLCSSRDLVGAFEMAGILLGVLALVIWRLIRTGRSGSFLFGFEVFGWAAVLAYLACWVISPDWIGIYSTAAFEFSWRIVGPKHTYSVDDFGTMRVMVRSDDRLSILLCASVDIFNLTTPQVLFAGLGGWLFRWLRVVVVIDRLEPNAD